MQERSSQPPSDDAAQRRADDKHADRALIALLVCLALAALGWLLVSKMSAATKMQDCIMSGRGNCAPVDPDAPAK
jgi:hypothetical protein